MGGQVAAFTSGELPFLHAAATPDLVMPRTIWLFWLAFAVCCKPLLCEATWLWPGHSQLHEGIT